MKAICNRIFAPASNSVTANIALLVLRVWLGVTLFANHGLSKLTGFSKMSPFFADTIHLGNGPLTLGLVVFAEVGCATLLTLGLLSRFAAFVLIINFSVAFFVHHKMALSGANSGELAFIYLAVVVSLLIAGPGRISADAMIFKKTGK
ncbi:MAG TPA: DoxX family protein [Verrucomicrobiae bacterium]|jgi:putative oxidoreductase|nr:DoxX family protein [Verrucomicrobiae bacterium]